MGSTLNIALIICRSSRSQMFFKIGVIKNFSILTGNQLWNVFGSLAIRITKKKHYQQEYLSFFCSSNFIHKQKNKHDPYINSGNKTAKRTLQCLNTFIWFEIPESLVKGYFKLSYNKPKRQSMDKFDNFEQKLAMTEIGILFSSFLWYLSTCKKTPKWSVCYDRPKHIMLRNQVVRQLW